ncbi:class I SAM-dependent methyltransferase [Nonomuraea cavernae]|uniref:class I SAM-dependent methyltransferase n=1 Tax=Nonomuraea cavernae TaxID=2045107 RepID=UPI0033FBA340
MTGSVFTDPAATAGLYRDSGRLAARTSALHRAKTHGRPVADVIAKVAACYVDDPSRSVVADIGCGRGTSSLVLAERLRPRRLVGLDASAAMLAAARARLAALSPAVAAAVEFVQADFHHLPLPDDGCDFAAAAFCLYHAPDPHTVIAEIARVLAPGGVAILVTKSADSYRELDRLVAAAGLDPGAADRPSLYAAAHGGNLADLTAGHLRVLATLEEKHRFAFAGLDHVAAYLATTPKYKLPPGLATDPDAIATRLRAAWPDEPVTATSTITYLTATPT